MNGSFLSPFFFSSHSCVNEIINPISVGIVPFRLFLTIELKWKGKKDKRIKEIFMNDSFLSLLFSSHRYPNEVINPISVGIGPFRLFWWRSLKRDKIWKKKDNKTNFYEWFISFSSFFFFLLTDIPRKSSIQFQLELFHSDCLYQDH